MTSSPFGAREKLHETAFGKFVLEALAKNLRTLVVPSPELAALRGLDLAAAGLDITANPRHADLLLIVGDLSGGLADAASIAFAQMLRPRAILALGSGEIAPLPAMSRTFALSQDGLREGLDHVRQGLMSANGGPAPFEAPALSSRVEFTCPMHPEIVADEPGNCPICGMTLVPKETSGKAAMEGYKHGGHEGHDHEGHAHEAEHSHGAGHGHADEHGANGHQAHPDHAMHQDHQMHGGGDHKAAASGPEGSHGHDAAPAMDHKPAIGAQNHGGQNHGSEDHGSKDHGGHQHGGHQHSGGETPEGVEEGFMSMVEMTVGMPAARDGLKMEKFDLPAGPFFAGLPGGLVPLFKMDGDGVAEVDIQTLVGRAGLLAHAGQLEPEAFVDQLQSLTPYAPNAYAALACAAIENAIDTTASDQIKAMRAAMVARDRIGAGLGWLALFLTQLGLSARARQAYKWCGQFAEGEIKDARPMAASLRRLTKSALLKAKLRGFGGLDDDEDVWARFVLRASGLAAELESFHDQTLDRTALRPEMPAGAEGTGMAHVQVLGGMAQLELSVRDGKITSAKLDTPSQRLAERMGEVLVEHELGDALIILGSFGLDPWEMHA